MIAAAGSPLGMRGITTMPAPRRPRTLEDRDDPVRAERAERADGALAAVGILAAVATPTVDALVAAGVEPSGAGAVPQTSQYPSTIVPPHPGSAHVMKSSPASAR
jgi:hypothetical protein